MRLRGKVGLGAAISVGVALLLVVVCLDTVDSRPYFNEPYYEETLGRIRGIAATNRVVRGEIRAGVGRARLTPEINATPENAREGRFREMPLAGYGQRKGRPAMGAHDDLYVKAVALQVGELRGIIFAADALIVPREVADAVAAQLGSEFGLRREQLYFSATHTHCSIGGWGEGFVGEMFAGKFQPAARAWFAQRFIVAAREALGDLKAAEFGHASFEAAEFVRNRLAKEKGRIDPEFSFLAFRQNGGKTAIVGSFAAHATVLPSSVMDFSGDYPGYFQRELEKLTGAEALFVAGAVGSHGPRAGESGFKGAERMGSALARMLNEKLKEVTFRNSMSFAIAAVDVALPALNVRVSDQLRFRPWLSGKLLSLPASGSFLQVFRMNDALWISTPCDFSGELALDLKDTFKVRGYEANITSFNGDYIGYVIRSRYYHLDEYESRVMSFYGPYVPDYLSDLIRELGLSVAQ